MKRHSIPKRFSALMLAAAMTVSLSTAALAAQPDEASAVSSAEGQSLGGMEETSTPPQELSVNEQTLTPPEPDADDGAADEAVTYELSTDSIATYSAGVDTSLTVAAQSETYIDVPTEGFVIDSNGVCKGLDSTWRSNHKLQDGQYYRLIIPDTVTKIEEVFNSGYYRFGDVIGAIDFSNATSLETIGDNAFSQQTHLTGVLDLSKTKVSVIGKLAFNGSAITGVILPDTLTQLGTSDTDGGATFASCKQLQYIRTARSDGNAVFELPASLTSIGKDSFRDSFANPIQIKIPATVKAIGRQAFDSANIKQIVVERTSGFSRYSARPFYNCPVVVMPDQSSYNELKDYLDSDQSALCYPIDLTFDGTGVTQRKLNSQSIQYELNPATGFWEQNTDYTLPEPSASNGVPDGFTATWQLNGKKLTNTSKLNVTGESATVGYDLALAAPTIEYVKNGEVQDSNTINVKLKTSGTQTVGIKLSHPLLDKELAEDEEVAVFYSWQDVKNRTYGPRDTEEPDIFNKTVEGLSEIPINKLEDARPGWPDEYRVYFALGYAKGEKTYWYESDLITLNVTTEQAPFYTVSYDPNGGTTSDDSLYADVPVEEGDTVTLPAAPTKDGMVFTGWSDGANTYPAGQKATITAATAFTAQWQSVEDWSKDPGDNSGGKLDIDVDVQVDVQVNADASASVTETDKTALCDSIRATLADIASGKTPAGMQAADVQKLHDLLTLGASHIDTDVTVEAALEPTPTEAELKAALGSQLAAGETAQLWMLRVRLTTVAKDGQNELSRMENVWLSQTSPITFALTTGLNLDGKNVRVLFVHDNAVETAPSSVTDAANGTVTVTASKFSPYYVLSKAKSAPTPDDKGNTATPTPAPTAEPKPTTAPTAKPSAGSTPAPAATAAPAVQTAQATAAPTATPAPTAQAAAPTPTVQPTSAIPSTGDGSSPLALAAVALAALTGLGVTARKKKSK